MCLLTFCFVFKKHIRRSFISEHESIECESFIKQLHSHFGSLKTVFAASLAKNPWLAKSILPRPKKQLGGFNQKNLDFFIANCRFCREKSRFFSCVLDSFAYQHVHNRDKNLCIFCSYVSILCIICSFCLLSVHLFFLFLSHNNMYLLFPLSFIRTSVLLS